MNKLDSKTKVSLLWALDLRGGENRKGTEGKEAILSGEGVKRVMSQVRWRCLESRGRAPRQWGSMITK